MDTAKLFQAGKSQAVRLPEEYRFEGTQVYVKKVGNAVVLIPEQDPWWSLIDSLDKFSADFMADRTQAYAAYEPRTRTEATNDT